MALCDRSRTSLKIFGILYCKWKLNNLQGYYCHLLVKRPKSLRVSFPLLKSLQVKHERLATGRLPVTGSGGSGSWWHLAVCFGNTPEFTSVEFVCNAALLSWHNSRLKPSRNCRLTTGIRFTCLFQIFNFSWEEVAAAVLLLSGSMWWCCLSKKNSCGN